MAFIMLVFVFAISLSDGRIIPAFLTRDATSNRASIEAQDNVLATGSIYIASPDSQICEHRQIDNNTWRIRDSGSVLCDRTGAMSFQQPERSTPSRIDAIRDGFFPRK